jgi:pantothenate synthetase
MRQSTEFKSVREVIEEGKFMGVKTFQLALVSKSNRVSESNRRKAVELHTFFQETMPKLLNKGKLDYPLNEKQSQLINATLADATFIKIKTFGEFNEIETTGIRNETLIAVATYINGLE